MSSKVGGTDNRGTGAVGAGRAVGRVLDVTGQPKTAEQQPDANDVHITGTARQLAELVISLGIDYLAFATARPQLYRLMFGVGVANWCAYPAVDEAKVAAISAAIENGTYKVSADKVADNLMQIEQALAPLNGK